MRMIMPAAVTLVALVAIPFVASAQQQQMAPAPRQEARVERAAYVCASDDATRRSFEREYGAAPVFVTAEQALQAAANGDRWEVPRCMTEAQHRRLAQLQRQIAMKN